MNDLVSYLKLIVEPTVEEFRRNPSSIRHAYLACVATYHASDRAAYPRNPDGLQQEWREKSREFAIVEGCALDFKHVKSRRQNRPPLSISRPSFAILGQMGFGTYAFNDTGQLEALRQILYAVEEAVKFLYSEAEGDGG